MSSICPTCKSSLSCGCQKRTASNGAAVCTMCIGRYEAELLKKKNQSASGPAPTIGNRIPPLNQSFKQ